MGRILAIDFGLKRTGLAVTDPMQIIATSLDTVPSTELLNFLSGYFTREQVDTLVLGLPRRLDQSDTDMTPHVKKLAETLKQKFPDKPLHLVDERFTSSMAKQAMIDGGMKKKDRRQKENIDKISATIILQSYLDSHPPGRR